MLIKISTINPELCMQHKGHMQVQDTDTIQEMTYTQQKFRGIFKVQEKRVGKWMSRSVMNRISNKFIFWLYNLYKRKVEIYHEYTDFKLSSMLPTNQYINIIYMYIYTCTVAYMLPRAFLAIHPNWT